MKNKSVKVTPGYDILLLFPFLFFVQGRQISWWRR